MPNQHPQPPPPKCPPTEHVPNSTTFTRPTLHLDAEEWLPYLDDPDASDEEKRQLIETLWGIVLSFVDLNWNVEIQTDDNSNLPPETSTSSIDLTRALHGAVVHLNEPEKEEV